MVFFNMLNTSLQSIVTDELRGRVMSVYTLTFFGAMPLGAYWRVLSPSKLENPSRSFSGR